MRLVVFYAKKNYLFWVGIWCVIVSEMLEYLQIQNILSGGMVKLLGVASLMGKILLDFVENKKDDIWTNFLAILMMVSSTVSFCQTGVYKIALVYLIIVAARGVEYCEILRFYVLLLTSTFIVNLLLVVVGLQNNNVIIDNTPGHYDEIRYSLGFMHPNMVLDYYVIVLITIMMSYGGSIKKKWIIAFLAGGITLFYFTRCRSGLLALVILLAVWAISGTRLKDIIMDLHIFIILDSVLFTGMFIMAFLYAGKRNLELNIFNTLIARFMSFGIYNDAIGISVLGTKIPNDIPWILDPSYYHIIFAFGWVGLVVATLLYCYCIYKMKRDYLYSGGMFVILLIFVFFNRYTNIAYTVLPIVAFSNNTGVLNASELGYYLTKNVSDRKYRSLNYATLAGYLCLIIGHQLALKMDKSYHFIKGTSTTFFRISDISLFMIGGAVTLYLSLRMKQNE